MNKREAADILGDALDKMLENEKFHPTLKCLGVRKIGQALKCLGYEDRTGVADRLQKENDAEIAAEVEKFNEEKRRARGQ